MFLLRRSIIFALLLTYVLALLISCKESDTDNGGGSSTSTPPLDGIPHVSVRFSDITYSRPDTDALYADISSAIALLRNGAEDTPLITERLKSIEAAYSDYLTMYSYARLMHTRDKSDGFYENEHNVLAKAYSDIFAAKERLSFAIARSEHKVELSSIAIATADTFKTEDVSGISDDYFFLLAREEKLKYNFSTISEHNVYITYDGITDTYSGTINRLKEGLGGGTRKFQEASDECAELYRRAVTESKLDIYISLINTRILIADTLGYASYNDYTADLFGYSHTAEEYQSFYEDVFKYLLPVYKDLSIKIFNPYFNNNTPKFLDKNTLITNMLSLYKSIDGDIYKAFAGMISSELYDIAPDDSTRSEASYIAYFHTMGAPFLFCKSYNDTRDYLRVAYSFGSYFDVLLDKTYCPSPMEAEMSSMLLGAITLSGITDSIGSDEGKYIYYYSMKNIMEDMIHTGFLSLLEQQIYNMDPADLSREALTDAVQQLAEKHSLPVPDMDEIVNTELILSPKTLQARTVSTFFAAEAYFNGGSVESKLQLYKALLNSSSGITPESMLSSYGISSPFDKDAAIEFSDKIFYSINGYHYYKSNSTDSPVA